MTSIVFYYGVISFFIRKELISYVLKFIFSFFVGVIGGILFEKIKIPKIIFYLIIGILFGGGCLNLIYPSLDVISDYLRQIALIIILTRSGLALDFKSLIKIGRPAILMCFLPASFEIIGIIIFGPLLLNISYLEATLLGCVLGAVSPAIVAPRMLTMIENKEGGDIPKVIMAGASCDDIYVIVIFYACLNALKTSSFNFLSILKIPSSIILGVLLGLLIGIGLINLFKCFKLNSTIKVIIMLGVSFLMVWLESYVKTYVSISALLGIIVMSIILSSKISDLNEVKQSYNHLWSAFEILLFVLVGTRVKLNLVFSFEGLKIFILILIGLSFRTIGVILSVMKNKYNLKEIIFFVVSYLPKATVQASIGAIALSEGLACGEIVLTASVIAIVFTAPVGAILIDWLKARVFLQKKEKCIEIID